VQLQFSVLKHFRGTFTSPLRSDLSSAAIPGDPQKYAGSSAAAEYSVPCTQLTLFMHHHQPECPGTRNSYYVSWSCCCQTKNQQRSFQLRWTWQEKAKG